MKCVFFKTIQKCIPLSLNSQQWPETNYFVKNLEALAKVLEITENLKY